MALGRPLQQAGDIHSFGRKSPESDMTDTAPTQEEMAAAQQVAAAGGQAAANSTPEDRQRNTRNAVAEEAKVQKLELTREHANMIADAIAEKFEQRGAFEPPPPPAQPPPAEGYQQRVPNPQDVQAPARKSFAERFKGAK